MTLEFGFALGIEAASFTAWIPAFAGMTLWKDIAESPTLVVTP